MNGTVDFDNLNLANLNLKLFLKTTKIDVHAFVPSKHDYCNSLLYNAKKYVLKEL